MGNQRREEMREQRQRQRRSTLIVQVRYEPSRVGAACLADAYEQVLPVVRRGLVRHDLRAAADTTPTERQEGVAG
jgi:hypothetical protein